MHPFLSVVELYERKKHRQSNALMDLVSSRPALCSNVGAWGDGSSAYALFWFSKTKCSRNSVGL